METLTIILWVAMVLSFLLGWFANSFLRDVERKRRFPGQYMSGYWDEGISSFEEEEE